MLLPTDAVHRLNGSGLFKENKRVLPPTTYRLGNFALVHLRKGGRLKRLGVDGAPRGDVR
jgi:hypothetical protein